MIDRYSIISVICNKCHKGFSGNQSVLISSKAEMKEIAEIMHKEVVEKEKILCFAPKLLIVYNNVLDIADIGKVAEKEKGN